MLSNKKIKKVILAVIILTLIIIFHKSNLMQYFTVDFLKSQQDVFNAYYNENKLSSIIIFTTLYIMATGLSLPGAAFYTITAGALFGLFTGVLLVSFASTIGATCAFLISRFFLRDSIKEKYAKKIKAIDTGIAKEGAFYLFSLRLVPLFPFFLINLLMGITNIRTYVFFFVSQIGMLPGTIAYVYAGTQLSKLDSTKGILSPELLIAFAIIGIMPLVAKKSLSYLKRRKLYKKYKKPKNFDYNLIVIGAGSAGLVSSYIAAAVKAKVALIEKHKMGGDCLNTGCVPSKALLRSAKIIHYAKRAQEYGFSHARIEFDFHNVMESVKQVIKKIAPHDSKERYTKLGVNCIQGEAKIISPYEVEVLTNNLNDKDTVNQKNGTMKITAKNIIIATGAKPQVPPIKGLKNINYYTSDNIWEMVKLPRKLLILGGGPIGCEMAQAFARLGSKVTIVEMAKSILIREDEEVIKFVSEVFKKEDIKIAAEYKAEEFVLLEDKKILICKNNNDKEVEFEFDEVLLALGRAANTTGFGIEEMGIEITERKTIAADPFLRTNYPNIFVCGDVTGPYQFTHTAAHQAWFASVNALFSPYKAKVNYNVIPWATFIDPEVAQLGLNEKSAKEQEIAYEVTTYDISDLDRSIADREAKGFIKVLTAPNTDKILGVTIVGPHASSIISEFVLAMKHKIGLNKILGTIHIYPTLSEANKYVAGEWKRQHSPKWVFNLLDKWHAYNRGQNSSLDYKELKKLIKNDK